jgi:putative glutamine amidotransferase
MSETRRPPLVLLPACQRVVDGRVFHATSAAYSDALRLAGCQPLLVTAESAGEFASLLEIADGILLPGSPNNVHPSHFGEEIHDTSLPLDPKRDALSLPLIREAIARGIPLLGICRGHQEFNVALGGSLHQAVHELPGHDNHQPTGDDPPEQRFGPVHTVRILPGGLLEKLLGTGTVTVNSVHGQAVHRLAPGLRIEALAPDGVIEAIHAPDAPGFNLGVQWHPEWQAAGNPVSEALFHAFGDACRAYRDQRGCDRPRA